MKLRRSQRGASRYRVPLIQRNQIGAFKDSLLFKQEYPANAAEAFQLSGHDSYIPPSLVARARKAVADPAM